MENISRFISLGFVSLLNYVIPKGRIITFWSFPDFSDNAYALFHHMASQGFHDYQMIWLVRHEAYETEMLIRQQYPNIRVRCYKKNSLRGMYYFLRSRYLFFTHGVYRNISRPRRQIAVHLGHGMPLKRIGYLDNRASTEIPNCTYAVATSALFQPILAKAWRLDERLVLVTGSPRNDLLSVEHSVLKKLCISEGQYIIKILWMPTYRVSVRGEIRRDGCPAESGLPLLNDEQLIALNQYLSQRNILCIVKAHPMDQTSEQQSSSLSHIRFLTHQTLLNIHADIHNLLGEIDVLLTDYSSIFFDFLLTDRPIGFIHSDVDTYRSDRGFLFEPMERWTPGCKIYTFEQLKAFINDIYHGVDHFVEHRKQVRERVHQHTEGSSSERLLQDLGLSPRTED